MAIDPKHLDLIKTAAKQNGFINYSIETEIGSMKGDNYLGVITAVTVREKDSDKVLHLILKAAQTDEHYRESTPVPIAFIREAEMYEKVLPELLSFQEEKALCHPFQGVAGFYGSLLEVKKEAMLMANLKSDGFQLWNRKEPMNPEHVTLVFTEYARLHAISFAFRNQNPDKFCEITQNILTNIMEGKSFSSENGKEFMGKVFNNCYKAIEDNGEATNILRRFQKALPQFFIDSRQNKESDSVVLHGDCWTNNMLFKYEDPQNRLRPTRVCFIDWQLSHVGSPIKDLAYFFCACASRKSMEELDKNLKIYYDVLSHNMKELGCNHYEVYSYETFINQWKKNALYGVFIALIVLRLIVTDSNDVPNFEDELKKGNSFVDTMDFKTTNMEYGKRLGDMLEFFGDKDYF